MKKLCSILTLIIIIISTSCKYQVQNNNLVTITDMLGDTITIPKNPQRVACVSRTTYDLLVAFGLSDKIDGAYKNIYDNPWLETVYPNSKNEYRYEYEENYETFLTRKIDLVFAPEKYISDNLKAHGINSLCISLYGNPTYDDYLFFFADMIMNIWDDKEVHKKVLTWKQDVIDAIEKCSNSNDNRIEYKKLFYVRGDKNKGIEYTDTKGSFTEFAFRKLGFDYAGKFFNTTKPSKEEICKYNPDVFVIGGGKIYDMLMPYCDEAIVTRLNYRYEADTYFPDLDNDDDWYIADESEEMTYFSIEYQRVIYKRKSKKEF